MQTILRCFNFTMWYMIKCCAPTVSRENVDYRRNICDNCDEKLKCDMHHRPTIRHVNITQKIIMTSITNQEFIRKLHFAVIYGFVNVQQFVFNQNKVRDYRSCFNCQISIWTAQFLKLSIQCDLLLHVLNDKNWNKK